MCRSRNLLVALICLALPAEAAASACKLTPVAALPLLPEVKNVPIVPARIAGAWTWLIIDTGAIRSLMFSRAADALNLARSDLRSNLDSVSSLTTNPGRVVRRGRNGAAGALSGSPPVIDTGKIVALNERQFQPFSIYGTGGQPIKEQTEGQRVQLGKLDFPDVSFLVIPNSISGDTAVAGMFGMDSLRRYDIELNLAQHWINLFSQDHCDGEVVYWGEAYLKAPIQITETGQVLVDAQLDGQRVRAMIDTGASHSAIRQGDASWLFGLSPQSPGAEAVESTTAADGSVLTTYRAPFKTLEVAGITFHNPEIHVLPNARDSNPVGRTITDQRGEAILTLGVNELSRLRIYLALQERMLYVTPASPEQPT